MSIDREVLSAAGEWMFLGSELKIPLQGSAFLWPLIFADPQSAEAKAQRLRSRIPDKWPWLAAFIFAGLQVAAIVVPACSTGGSI